jgi:lipoate-protein ligase B
LIVPCGIDGVTMTSIARETGDRAHDLMDRVKGSVVAHLADQFERRPESAAVSRDGTEVGPPVL